MVAEHQEIKCLDHGYVKLIETWGSDESIVSAARMSTGKGFLGWGDDIPCNWRIASQGKMCNKGVFNCGIEHKIGDEKLLSYLYTNKHATPFEMAGMIIEVQAPIFVFREWVRHRTQSYNEMSARYVPLPDVNYVPTVERLMMNSKTNKQAGTVKGAAELTTDAASTFMHELQTSYANTQKLYEKALSMGIPKELARVHLPVGRYSRMRASANLRNWLAFLTLRMAPAAQYEIRMYANVVSDLLGKAFPRTRQLFVENL